MVARGEVSATPTAKKEHVNMSNPTLSVEETVIGTFLVDAVGETALRVPGGVLLSDGTIVEFSAYEKHARWPVILDASFVGKHKKAERVRRFVTSTPIAGDEKSTTWRHLVLVRNGAVARNTPGLPDPDRAEARVARVRDLAEVHRILEAERPTFDSPIDCPVPKWATEVGDWMWLGPADGTWERTLDRVWRWPEGGNVRIVALQEAHADGSVETASPSIMLDFAGDELTSATDARDVAGWLLEAAVVLERSLHPAQVAPYRVELTEDGLGLPLYTVVGPGGIVAAYASGQLAQEHTGDLNAAAGVPDSGVGDGNA